MNFRKTPKQREATSLLKLFRHILLFGGSRSGKTTLLVRAIFIRAMKCPGTNHLIFRRHFNHAKQSIWHQTIPKVIASCFPELKGRIRLNQSDWYVEFPNGSKIWIGGIDDKERMEKILGNEYSTIYANESSQITWEAIVIMRTRLAENMGLENKFYYDCNPPTKSHWSYCVFVARVDPTTRIPLKNPDDYAYLLMNPADNETNLPAGYIEKELENLPERARQRFLLGIFLDEIEGSLIKEHWINDNRSHFETLAELEAARKITRKIIGVDPAITNKADSDLTGIVVVAEELTPNRKDEYHIIADHSLIASPNEWATKIKNVFELYDCDAIVVEVNQGGDMVKDILRNAGFTGMIYEVHASKSKFARAEPIAALYEQKKVHHLSSGDLKDLELEMVEYVPLLADKSPDRLDALVWAISHLTGEDNLNAQLMQQIDFKKLGRQI